ncbi:MBL fold metallo-hydrolase [Arthrobacter sp. SA17]
MASPLEQSHVLRGREIRDHHGDACASWSGRGRSWIHPPGPGEEKVLYISGDTTYESDLDQIGEKFSIGVAVLHLGAAKFAILGDQMISLDSANAAKFTASLGAHTVVPIHFSSWEHFTETEDEIAASFAEAGLTDRLKWLTPECHASLRSNHQRPRRNPTP